MSYQWKQDGQDTYCREPARTSCIPHGAFLARRSGPFILLPERRDAAQAVRGSARPAGPDLESLYPPSADVGHKMLREEIRKKSFDHLMEDKSCLLVLIRSWEDLPIR